ncbi:MAG TPA: dicarboxylate/amino acid:cation symporter [Gemmatimonadota bacterium]|nr:dicarboxylate/amino acid:cation symporter [Gemmatimonadota bacterium]
MSPSDHRGPWARLPLPTRILIGLATGLILGIVANIFFSDAPWLDPLIQYVAYPIGQIFLRLIFMIVIPLIFAALTLGAAELGDLRKLGRIGIKTFVFALSVTFISVAIGVTLVNALQPGRGIDPAAREELIQTLVSPDARRSVEQADEARRTNIIDTLLNIIPRNPVEDAARAFDGSYRGGGLLAVMFFALVFGVALATIDRKKTEGLVAAIEGLYWVVMKIIGFAMRLAPYGVAALLFSVAARLGFDIILVLAKYVGVVLLGLALHQFGVYSILVRVFARMSPITFFRKIREIMIVAFSTSSSNATLPTALRVTEERLGVPREISGFVLTLGSTGNQNGTALFEGVTVLFLAQFFGVSLGVPEQIQVVLMSILAGVGTAGVPGGSLPLIVLVLQSVGVPGEGIGVILGVDRLLDMCRTTVNVTGDVAAAAYVARSEGVELDTVIEPEEAEEALTI